MYHEMLVKTFYRVHPIQLDNIPVFQLQCKKSISTPSKWIPTSSSCWIWATNKICELLSWRNKCCRPKIYRSTLYSEVRNVTRHANGNCVIFILFGRQGVNQGVVYVYIYCSNDDGSANCVNKNKSIPYRTE